MTTLMRRVFASAALVILGVTAFDLQAQDPQPAAEPRNFVTIKLEGACDDKNQRLWLTNSHTYKTIATTLRWRAAGGKDLREQFFPAPNSTQEIGCAAEAEIVEVSFAAF